MTKPGQYSLQSTHAIKNKPGLLHLMRQPFGIKICLTFISDFSFICSFTKKCIL
jgi:hypothetical protein